MLFALLVAWFAPGQAFAQKPSFTVGWSVYAGWEPYYYMAKSGILRKWADKYGITIKVQRFDYAPSLDAFVAKNIDACAMTNMEALDMPAAAGVDTTAIIVGDYSNGNDAVLVRHDLSARARSPARRCCWWRRPSRNICSSAPWPSTAWDDQIKKVRYLNTSDSDIAAAFISDSSKEVVVTWKPLVSQIAQAQGREDLVQFVADSRRDSGPDGGANRRSEPARRLGPEVRQGARRRLVRTDASDVRGWTGDRQGAGQRSPRLRRTRSPSYKEQLSTTQMFFTPQSAAADGSVAGFEKDHGSGAASSASRMDCWARRPNRPTTSPFSFPTAACSGKADRVRLRFDAELHAAGGAREAMSRAAAFTPNPDRTDCLDAFLVPVRRRHHAVLLHVAAARIARIRTTA